MIFQKLVLLTLMPVGYYGYISHQPIPLFSHQPILRTETKVETEFKLQPRWMRQRKRLNNLMRGDPFDYFFDDPFMTGFDILPFSGFDTMPFFDAESDMMTGKRTSPGYEYTEDEEQVKIVVDVPGVKLEDMSVEIEEGRAIRIRSLRKMKKDNVVSESRFDKRFMLGESVEISKITANLSSGVLCLTMPKKDMKVNVEKVAITEVENEKEEEAIVIEKDKEASVKP